MIRKKVSIKLKIDVLINSPGPHDYVRVREPFLELIKKGVDCRIHERPFIFNKCIRSKSIVIWQRPLPESRNLQWQYLQWLRKKGCILLTEWDDSPKLFPNNIHNKLTKIKMAPLELCHCIHTSNYKLLKELNKYNPIGISIDNTINNIPKLDLIKHEDHKIRVFIGNQNRHIEHEMLSEGLKELVSKESNIKLIIIEDEKIVKSLPKKSFEYFNLLEYEQYRNLLSTCHIALLPLIENPENACKTPIKLIECAAESVVGIVGPCLYKRTCPKECSIQIDSLKEIIKRTEDISKNKELRKSISYRAHNWVKKYWTTQDHLTYRLWIYQKLWEKRKYIDNQLVNRINKSINLPKILEREFDF